MGNKLLISAFDVAMIVDGLSLGAKEEAMFKERIWKNEKEFLRLNDDEDMKKWLYKVQHWTDYIYGNEELNQEFHAAQDDLQESGAYLQEDDYMTDGLDLSIVFKSLRLRLLYVHRNGSEKTTLHAILSAYGYGEGRPFIMSYIQKCMDFYRIKAFYENGNECELKKIDPRMPIVFKIMDSVIEKAPSIAETGTAYKKRSSDYEKMDGVWVETNTRSFSIWFCEMVKGILQNAKYLGDKQWGSGGGAGLLPTYEINTPDGETVWCATVEYVHSGTGIPNRRGVIATFPATGKGSLPQPLAVVIPYEYGKKFNTLAYKNEDYIEIRNYGKITSGRNGFSRTDFFAWMEGKHPEKINVDQDGNQYFNVYQFEKELTAEQFSVQTYEAVRILSEVKSQGKVIVPQTERLYVDDSVAEKVAAHLITVSELKFSVSGRSVVCTKGMQASINNQGGDLRDNNFLGRNLEFTLRMGGQSEPIAFQLYENTSGHYRLFVYGKGNKMLTSVNLTTGLSENRIQFCVQIKVTSPQSLSRLQRERKRDDIVKELRHNGLSIDERNVVEFGCYDIKNDSFIGTNPSQVLRDLLTIGICKNRERFPLF